MTIAHILRPCAPNEEKSGAFLKSSIEWVYLQNNAAPQE